jgi:FtsZ-interacting cell division protein ZipA
MKKAFKILIITLLIALIWLLCLSCGARKVQKEHSKEEAKTALKDNSVTEKHIDTNVKSEAKTTIDDKDETVTEETTYTPADPTKESYVIEKDGTKTVLSNAKKIVKKETKKNNTQSELVSKTDELKKESVKEKKAVKQSSASKKENSSKEVKKEPFNWFNMLWFLIPIAIIYIFYRIYKKLPII